LIKIALLAACTLRKYNHGFKTLQQKRKTKKPVFLTSSNKLSLSSENGFDIKNFLIKIRLFTL